VSYLVMLGYITFALAALHLLVFDFCPLQVS
jgi:hypothetical protein